MGEMSELAIVEDASEHAELDAATLRVLMAAAAYQARRVARTLRLSEVDREEAEHDILLALLERRRFFNPARGPWPPFAHRIARQEAQTVADNLVAHRRRYASLDQPAGTNHQVDLTTLSETIRDDTVPSEDDILDRMSLAAFVAGLPAGLREVAAAALDADGELAEAQRALGLSTSEFYRRVREIRYRLFTIGLVDHRRFLSPPPPGKSETPCGYLDAVGGNEDLSGREIASTATETVPD
jgi:DNA-directed RNA polymerase specialized sigma24 family protein